MSWNNGIFGKVKNFVSLCYSLALAFPFLCCSIIPHLYIGKFRFFSLVSFLLVHISDLLNNVLVCCDDKNCWEAFQDRVVACRYGIWAFWGGDETGISWFASLK